MRCPQTSLGINQSGRACIVVTLQQVGSGIDRNAMLLLVLDAFADHRRTQLVNDVYELGQHAPRARIDHQLRNQVAVQLDDVGRKIPEPVEVGFAAAEVIDGNAVTQLLVAGQRLDQMPRIGHQRFDDFQHHLLRANAAVIKQGLEDASVTAIRHIQQMTPVHIQEEAQIRAGLLAEEVDRMDDAAKPIEIEDFLRHLGTAKHILRAKQFTVQAAHPQQRLVGKGAQVVRVQDGLEHTVQAQAIVAADGAMVVELQGVIEHGLAAAPLFEISQ